MTYTPAPAEEQAGPQDAVRAVEAYWDDAAATFDEGADHGLGDPLARAAWRDLVLDALPPAPATVADLACGTGTLSELMAEGGHAVRGLDLSTEMVRRARAKTARFGARVTIERADVSDPPLRPGSVDGVLARHILWTLPDPHASVSRWVRLVRPGGRLLLIEGVWGSEAADAIAKPALPWRGGVPSAELAAHLAGLDAVADVQVTALVDSVYWGHPVDHERYLLVAEVAAGAAR